VTFLFLTFLAIAIQGFFALFEMAALSMNRLRLQYYASIGNKRALWLSALLKNPSRFFGTTLIGVNAALQIGSECSRKFYESMHLDPDFAPLTQVLLVVIFAELSPMFAARRHPSQIALSLVPFMSLISRIMVPFIWAFEIVSRLGSKWMKPSKEASSFFSREEVATAFRQRGEGHDELNEITEQIFQLKNRTVGQIMTPLEKGYVAHISTKVSEISEELIRKYEPMIPIYRHQKTHIVAIAYVRDLLKLGGDDSIFASAKAPWFVTENLSILEILNQFRRNNQSAAVVLDVAGTACGILTLDQIISQIFGNESASLSEKETSLYIERTLAGEMTVSDFNEDFQCDLECEEGDTLSDLIVSELGHLPSAGETLRLEPFIFTVVEPTIRGVSIVSVRTIND